MRASPQGRRLKPFRLTDIPEPVRMLALERLLGAAVASSDGMIVPTDRPADRIVLAIVAERPSDRVHWITVDAWEKAARRWPK